MGELKRLEEHFSIVNMTMENVNKLLTLIYFQTQEHKAQETPGKLEPVTVNLDLASGSRAIQILPNNGYRQEIGIYNSGPGDLVFNSSHFDSSIFQQFSDPSDPDAVTPPPNQLIRIGYLPSGASMTVKSSASLWGLNINGAALITCLESVYDSNPHGYDKPPGYDGWMNGGYVETTTEDGDLVVTKALV